MELLDRVRRTIRRHDLAGSDTRVVVGLSGGADSVALAHILKILETAGELHVAGVAHFNHQLRPAALEDERFSAEVASALGWEFVVDREDVAGRARRERHSIETAARAARHEFFVRARGDLNADVVAVGHTRDDQAETFLLRLLRGAGARGLSSMHPRHDHVVRPLLDVRRADLRSFLEARHIGFVHDTSNDDVAIPRNRIRTELLPFLERRFNQSVVDVLADEANLAREESRWMEAAADALEPGLWQHEDRTWRTEAVKLEELPAALARLLTRRALTEASGGRSIGFAHVEEVRELARSGPGPVSVPGCRAERLGAFVVLTREPDGQGGRRQKASANLFSYPLSIPGEIGVREVDAVVSAELAQPAGVGRLGIVTPDGPMALVRLDRCGRLLTVRNRRPGDRFRPLGLDGRKKLQDFFVDRKVPRAHRDRVPLVVDELDRIVWVAGHTIDEEVRVTDPAQAVLILRLKPLGGPP